MTALCPSTNKCNDQNYTSTIHTVHPSLAECFCSKTTIKNVRPETKTVVISRLAVAGSPSLLPKQSNKKKELVKRKETDKNQFSQRKDSAFEVNTGSHADDRKTQRLSGEADFA